VCTGFDLEGQSRVPSCCPKFFLFSSCKQLELKVYSERNGNDSSHASLYIMAVIFDVCCRARVIAAMKKSIIQLVVLMYLLSSYRSLWIT
jgi:hypothetical protein